MLISYTKSLSLLLYIKKKDSADAITLRILMRRLCYIIQVTHYNDNCPYEKQIKEISQMERCVML